MAQSVEYGGLSGIIITRQTDEEDGTLVVTAFVQIVMHVILPYFHHALIE